MGQKNDFLVVLDRPPLILKPGEKAFTVQKNTARIFEIQDILLLTVQYQFQKMALRRIFQNDLTGQGLLFGSYVIKYMLYRFIRL